MEKTTKLFIKGMVCDRCIYVLSEEFSKLGLDISEIRLGEVILKESEKNTVEEQVIVAALQKKGFDLLYSKTRLTVDKIKNVVEKGIQQQLATGQSFKFSELISNELHKDYGMLSSLFSSSQGHTLEEFIIAKKMDKVIELLVYGDQSLSEIAYALGYSSPAHLANQLKKNTGHTSSYYKLVKREKTDLIKKTDRQ